MAQIDGDNNCDTVRTERSEGSLERAGSVDRRDGVEAAAAEIVLRYVGFPSLSEHERVCGIIRKEIATRGVRPLNNVLYNPPA